MTDRDRQFILNPSEWPLWPFLPLKRRDHNLDMKNLGLLVAAQRDEGFTVHHVCLHDLPMSREAFHAAPKTHYPTADALLADGWVVD